MKKILLIDDDVALCETLLKILKDKGFSVLLAHSAREGLKKTLDFRPDLIITDVLMETDTAGFELLYQLRDDREDSRYKDVCDTPVLFLSAIHQITHFRFSLGQRRAFLPKNSGLMTKPVVLDDLFEEIQRVLGEEVVSS